MFQIVYMFPLAGSQQLWLDYLGMELAYAAKLAGRRQVLGISAGAAPLSISCRP